MQLETEEWVTGSEAARLLSVTPQRVMTMADDGLLEVTRPWDRVALIRRRSIADWLAGNRPARIQPYDARRWLLKRYDVGSVQEININVVRDALLEFVMDARPRWTKVRQDLWALEMADRLFSSGSPA